MFCLSLLLPLHLYLFSQPFTVGAPLHKEYAVLIDAGSSKSQLYVFQWFPAPLPIFNGTKGLQVEPGIATFAGNISAIEPYMKRLIDDAKTRLPRDVWASTSIYLLSTAGMRLLEDSQANKVMFEIIRLFNTSLFNPFLYSSPENTRILSGEEEGIFAWIAVNYKANKLSSGGVKDTVGVLELGGASTQIAFSTESSIFANKHPITLAGTTYPLYVYSHLPYGQSSLLRLLKQHLISRHPSSTSIPHPCLVLGDNQTEGNRIFVGAGNSSKCYQLIQVFVRKLEEEWRCNPKPCSIGSAYQPVLPAGMSFHLVGAFVYTLERIKLVNSTHPRLSLPLLKETTDEFCTLTSSQVMQRFPISIEEYISLPCMIGNYMQLLLHVSYGFEWDTSQLLSDNSAEWTLGALIYEHERKCTCSQQLSASSKPLPSPLLLFFPLLLFSLA